MVSIVDVAKKADVSVTTVSRVLNNHPKVRRRNRRLVMQAIEELGYVPNETARGLRKSRSQTIGFVAFDLDNQMMLNLVKGVEAAVREQGYSLLLCDSENDPETEAQNLMRLYQRRVEGLLMFGLDGSSPALNLFLNAGVPVLAFDLASPPPGAVHLATEDRQTMRAVLDYLAALGHRRVAFVATNRLAHTKRFNHFRELSNEMGLSADPSLLVACATEDECLADTKKLLLGPGGPTAVVAGSITVAPYVLGGLKAAGKTVPDDVSVVAMGDAPWARFSTPALTVMAADYATTGKLAAEFVLSRAQGDGGQAILDRIRQTVTRVLTIRESCAPPKPFTRK